MNLEPPKFGWGTPKLGVVYTFINGAVWIHFYEKGRVVCTEVMPRLNVLLKIDDNGILEYWSDFVDDWCPLTLRWHFKMQTDGGFLSWTAAIIAAKIDRIACSTENYIPFKCTECAEFFSYPEHLCRMHDRPICVPCWERTRADNPK